MGRFGYGRHDGVMTNRREQTRRIRLIFFVCVMLCVPSNVWADSIFTSFVGRSFQSDATEKVTTWGVGLATMAGGVFGFEFDFGQTGKATTASAFVENSGVMTVIGNIIAGVPVCRCAGVPVCRCAG